MWYPKERIKILRVAGLMTERSAVILKLSSADDLLFMSSYLKAAARRIRFSTAFFSNLKKIFINHPCEHINLFYNVRIVLTLDGGQFSLSQLLQCQTAIMLISTNKVIQYSVTLLDAIMTYILLHKTTIASLTQILTICGCIKMTKWKENSR